MEEGISPWAWSLGEAVPECAVYMCVRVCSQCSRCSALWVCESCPFRARWDPVISLQASHPPSLAFCCLYPIGTRTRDIYIPRCPHVSFQRCFIIFTWHLLSCLGLCQVLVARAGLFSSCGTSLSCSPAGLWGTRAPAAALPKPQSTGSIVAAHRPDCSTTPGSGLLPDRRRNPRTRYH